MWSAGSSPRHCADVYLSRDEVATVGTDGALWHRRCDSPADGMDAVAVRLRETHSPRSLRVWLSGSLCRPVRLAAIAGKLSRAERVRLWEDTAATASGLAAPCRVMFDLRGDGGSAIAVVVEEATLKTIADATCSMRARAVSIRPWWAEALADALRSNAGLRAFAAWEGAALTTLTSGREDFTSAQSMYPIDDLQAAMAAFARGQVSAMVSSDEAVAVTLDWSSVAFDGPARASGGGAGAAAFAAWTTPLGVQR